VLNRILILLILLSGLFGENDTLNISITIADVQLSVDDSITPKEFKFHPASPNPFNNQVLLRWDLDHSGKVDLLIFDLLGRKVWNQNWFNVEPGQYYMKWNGKDNYGSNLSAGIYMVQLKTNQKSSMQKIIFLK